MISRPGAAVSPAAKGDPTDDGIGPVAMSLPRPASSATSSSDPGLASKGCAQLTVDWPLPGNRIRSSSDRNSKSRAANHPVSEVFRSAGTGNQNRFSLPGDRRTMQRHRGLKLQDQGMNDLLQNNVEQLRDAIAISDQTLSESDRISVSTGPMDRNRLAGRPGELPVCGRTTVNMFLKFAG